MTNRISDYDASVTEPSRRELVEIARWLQETGQTTYLVGGWAVYFHTQSRERPSARLPFPVDARVRIGDPAGFQALGSKDIDLVFENKKAREAFEQNYCRPNGYLPPKRLLERDLWRKPVGKTEILLDFDLLANTWPVRRANVGWAGLTRHHAKVELSPGVSVLVPQKELLLLYKCVALVERSDQRGRPNVDLTYLDSKIWKDANDILALHDTGVNEKVLGDLADTFALKRILQAAKEIISANYASYGFTQYAFSNQFFRRKP